MTNDGNKMSISPIGILKDAQESIPAVKYAAGVAGVAAVVAIVAGFQLDYRIAVFGTIIVFGLMFLLVIFSSFVSHSGASAVMLATFAAWSFLLLTVAASLFLVTSYFFSWPRSIESYIDDRVSKEDQPVEIQALAATGYARLASEQGDYIGQGEEYEFSDENGLFTVRGGLNSISIYFEGDDHWSFDFSAPRGEVLEAGRYSSAQRAAFKNPVRPGIDVSGAGRGCNEISGSFDIQHINFRESNALERFAAEFEQRCESGSPTLRGEINIRVSNTIERP